MQWSGELSKVNYLMKCVQKFKERPSTNMRVNNPAVEETLIFHMNVKGNHVALHCLESFRIDTAFASHGIQFGGC